MEELRKLMDNVPAAPREMMGVGMNEMTEVRSNLERYLGELVKRAEQAEAKYDTAMELLRRVAPVAWQARLSFGDRQQVERALRFLGVDVPEMPKAEPERCHYCEQVGWHEEDCHRLLDQVAESLPVG